jgi:hypothetical protein
VLLLGCVLLCFHFTDHHRVGRLHSWCQPRLGPHQRHLPSLCCRYIKSIKHYFSLYEVLKDILHLIISSIFWKKHSSLLKIINTFFISASFHYRYFWNFLLSYNFGLLKTRFLVFKQSQNFWKIFIWEIGLISYYAYFSIFVLLSLMSRWIHHTSVEGNILMKGWRL